MVFSLCLPKEIGIIMRLVTHNDFDGIVCAVLIDSVEEIESISFADPSAVQHKEFIITSQDIIADLPYHHKCAMWFDHHASSAPKEGQKFEGLFKIAPSAARVVFDYYENPYLDKFKDLVDAADKLDSGNLTLEEVRKPTSYGLLSITLESDDIREDHDYRRRVIDWLEHKQIDEVLKIPEVVERYTKKLKDYDVFRAEIPKYTKVTENVCFTDVRRVAAPPRGPSYIVYSIWPECNVSMKAFDFQSSPTEVGISVGHNVFNRTCKTDIGALMKKYGGGGHFGVGGCRVKRIDSDKVISEILEELKKK
jgi:oligoribonuclease NrnB/cAMP/cGMP phosphodiesterase (DHH superfamily)